MNVASNARRLSATMAMVVAVLFAVTGSAQAAVPITSFFAGPVTPTGSCAASSTVTSAVAASRSDFCVAFSTVSTPAIPASGDDLQRMVIDTPTGFAGAPDGVGVCTDAQFDYTGNTEVACPTTSQVGDVSSDARLDLGLTNDLRLRGVPGRVFSLVHSSNEAARLGIILDTPSGDKIKILVRVTLRPAPDVGLRSIIDNLPRTAELAGDTYPLAVDAFALRFWGSKANHPTMPADFGLIGSDCTTDQQTHLASTSYEGGTSAADAAPYRLTGCDAVPFTPSAEITTSERRPDVTTSTTVAVRFADYTSPLTSASVKTAVLTLPPGLTLSGQIASGADGLPLCTAEQFAQTRPETNGCPAATIVGDASFKSPLLSTPLNGHAYLGSQPGPGELPDLYIEGQLGTAADAPRVKLIGHLAVDDQNRVVTTLSNLPQVLVNEFSLTFRGGDHSALVTPPTCGAYTGILAATPYSNPSAPVTTESPYTVDQDCDAVGSFSPTVSFASADATAGASAPFTTTITRPDRSQRITKTSVDLPNGFLATLKGVPECSLYAAALSACPADTRVGSISSLAGVGPAPFNAKGDVYLTSPENGAVAGLSLSVPIKFGDVDLGTLAVPATVQIRPAAEGLRFVADVPERFKGIPLNIQAISVVLDRPGFPLNPTDCSPLSSTSTLTGSAGAVASVQVGFQVGNCAALRFSPTVDASVTGTTSNGGRPNLSVRITQAAGSGALKQAFVTLPKGISVDLAQIPRSCAIEEFQAGGCASTSIIGSVSGQLSITDETLAGDLYLLKAPAGKTLPSLGLAFKGRYAARIVGTNQIDTKTGQLITIFDSIADLPLTRFQIDLQGGTGGLLVATKELCTSDTVDFVARFVSHSGPTENRTLNTQCGIPLGELGVSGSPNATARFAGMRKGSPVLILGATPSNGKKIAEFRVTMPSGFSLNRSRAASSRYIAVKNLTVKGSVKSKALSSRTVRMTLPKGGSTKVRLLTRTGAMTIGSSSLRKTKKKQTIKIWFTYVDGTKSSFKLQLAPH